MVSVILVCWKRFEHFEEIIRIWCKEPEVDEVIVWDNSGSFTTTLPVTLINSQDNLNPSVRYMLASIAKNDFIIHCDDDVLPHKGITADFLQYIDDDSFLGVEGVNFTGDSYFNQRRIKSTKILSPTKPELVIGFLTMIHKKHLLGINCYDLCKYQLEMDLQVRSPYLKKVIIPTNKYTELGCGKDENALHLMEAGRAEKERMYKLLSGQKNSML